MSVATVRSKVFTKLQEMQSLKAVYDWETSNTSGYYPFATLTLRAGEANFQSSAHNLRKTGFRVRIYQERTSTGQGPENAEDIITSVLDEIYTAFDGDTTLSGAVKWVRPVNWVAEYRDREVDTRILEINLDAFELVSSQ